MIYSNSNSTTQCDKHNMFICPNLINIENDDVFSESFVQGKSYNDALDCTINETLDMFRNDISESFYFEEERSEEDFHFNLMNRKNPNPNQYPHDFDLDIFADNMDLSFNIRREVSRVLRKIESNNPEIFRFLTSKNIPYPIARRLVRRIVVLTLVYGDCKL